MKKGVLLTDYNINTGGICTEKLEVLNEVPVNIGKNDNRDNTKSSTIKLDPGEQQENLHQNIESMLKCFFRTIRVQILHSFCPSVTSLTLTSTDTFQLEQWLLNKNNNYNADAKR